MTTPWKFPLISFTLSTLSSLAIWSYHELIDFNQLQLQYHNNAPLPQKQPQQAAILSSFSSAKENITQVQRSYFDSFSSSNSTATVLTTVGNLYLCGYVDTSSLSRYADMFPFHQYVALANTSDSVSSSGPPNVTANDVMVVVGRIKAEPACPLSLWNNRLSAFRTWITETPAKVLLTNGESYGELLNPTPNIYQIGYFPDHAENRTMRVRFVQWVLMQYGPERWRRIFDPQYKPQGKAERFLVYAASKCKVHRELAVDQLSEIGIIDQGGKCGGIVHRSDRFRDVPELQEGRLAWYHNIDHFQPYRFCLVMENTYQAGYVTEKILNAFLAGCVPIYYGSTEVFDLFHRDSFIYYNISDPQPALDRIQYLETNRTAYDEMKMNVPILAHGEDTIREYFSLTMAMGGNGTLMKRLHAFMGLPSL